MARTPLGLWKFVPEMLESWRQVRKQMVIMKMFSVLYGACLHLNRLDEAIRMSARNIQFHDKIRKFPSIFVF